MAKHKYLILAILTTIVFVMGLILEIIFWRIFHLVTVWGVISGFLWYLAWWDLKYER